ncbi:hypothetical protein ACFO9Q_09215 [Paenibacillus sp. GCM10023252]|uniref:hypothetical protein n=1 Tax=Paenibacillus sp. GCM10023252 TaxID=3252649 RepID=UPI003622B141
MERESIVVAGFNEACKYIFESSLALSCRYIQCCRSWTSKPIYVITESFNPRAIYRGLGADHIIFTRTGEVGFLLNESESE